ncbi:MAG: ABC transporter permease [Gemmatimonadales bacterium]
MTGSLGGALIQAWRARSGRLGAVILLLILVAGALLPAVLPDPARQPCLLCGAEAPSLAHPLGTDQLSRDVLARVVWGARVSLAVAALAVGLSMTLGALVGLVAGYAGGWLDALLMRFVDGALAIPRLFVLLLLLAIITPIPLWLLILVLGATGWLGTSRLVRGEVLRLKQESYVQAAEAMGAGPARVIFRHLLPNTAGPLLVAATLAVGDVILLEAGLSFLGLGIQPPRPSWGGMIHDARDSMIAAPWISIFPGLAIIVTVLAVNLVGDALRDAIDPRNA